MYEEHSNKELVEAVLGQESKDLPIDEYSKHMMDKSTNCVSIDCLLSCHSYLSKVHDKLGYAVDDELILLKDEIDDRISEYNQNKDVDETKVVSLSRLLVKNTIVRYDIKSYDDFTCEFMKELAKELHLLD